MHTHPDVLSASTVKGDEVVNARGEKLGKIEDVMLDMSDDRIAYAVLSFGGFMGFGDKLFAVPWKALKLDNDHKNFILDVTKEHLKSAPGFDKDHWPDFADRTLAGQVYDYYGVARYW
jgi:sporulation protein YlmC with PRC-barrel domain